MPESSLPRGRAIVAGCGHGGLATIRSLGRHGVHVIAITDDPNESGLRSRFIDERAMCPHPADEDAFIGFLLDHADEWRGALIIETNDYYATTLAKHKATLSEHYRLVVPELDVVNTFIEKDMTYALAERCGVEYPALIAPVDMAELERQIEGIVFPVMVKPVRSHEFVAHFGTKLFVVDDEAELRKMFAKTLEANTPVVICEIIPGSDYRSLERLWIYVGTTGEVHVEAFNTKIRQTPPMFGITRVGTMTPRNDELLEVSTRLLEASGLTGTAGFEFKRDPRDGRLKLIEVNIRMMADVQLMISAGVDIPWIMYEDHVNGVRNPPPPHDTNGYWIYLIPDIYRFVSDRDPPSLRAFLEPYLARKKSFAYLSMRDPKPFVSEVRRRLVKQRRS